jgi:hypothetical protein
VQRSRRCILASTESKLLTPNAKIYFPELFAPLLRTLIQLSSPPFVDLPDELVVVIAYRIRSLTKESPFWSAFGLWFSFEPVLMKPLPSGNDLTSPPWTRIGSLYDDSTFIFVARRRRTSFSWTIPWSDQELMDGIGAYDTNVSKGDDTFENLLLMTMQADE